MKVIFITGHRKCGTSLLHQLFDNHPEVCSYPVDLGVFYAYFPKYVSSSYSPSQRRERLAHILLQSMKRHVKYHRINYNLSTTSEFIVKFLASLSDADLISKSAIFNTLMQTWVDFTGNCSKKAFVCKETSQLLFLEDILKSSPDHHILQLFRDPRDNWSAIRAGLNTYYTDLGDTLASSLASVVYRVNTDFFYYQHLASLGNNRHIIALKYEDLVDQTESLLPQLAQTLHLADVAQLYVPTLFGNNTTSNTHDPNSNVKGRISRSSIGSWRQRIPMNEAIFLEFYCKAMLQYFNYETTPLHDLQPSLASLYSDITQALYYSDSFSGNFSR